MRQRVVKHRRYKSSKPEKAELEVMEGKGETVKSFKNAGEPCNA